MVEVGAAMFSQIPYGAEWYLVTNHAGLILSTHLLSAASQDCEKIFKEGRKCPKFQPLDFPYTCSRKFPKICRDFPF